MNNTNTQATRNISRFFFFNLTLYILFFFTLFWLSRFLFLFFISYPFFYYSYLLQYSA